MLSWMDADLDQCKQHDLYRRRRRPSSAQGPRLRIGACDYLNFTSNDYLNLAADPRLWHCFENVDALLCPATRGPALDAETTGDPAFNSPWSYTGVPAVSLLSSWTPEGLPLSVQLVGRPWSEAELLATAAWCEAHLEVERRTP